MKKKKYEDEKEGVSEDALVREYNLKFFLNSACNTHLVCYYDVFINRNKKDELILIMSYIPGDELLTTIYTDEEKEIITKKLLIALSILHFHGIIHADIKFENIIYNKTTREVTLFDYGLSCVMPKIEVNDYKSKIEVPTCKDNLTKVSHFVIDPRLIEKSRNRKIKSEDWKKADLYSLGIVLFTLWIGNIFSRYKDDDIRFYTSQKKTNLIKDYLEEDKSINANLFKLISNLIEGDKSINEIYTECKDEKLYKFEL